MQNRKTEHLQICLNNKIETGKNGLEKYQFIHNSLPELNLEEIDTSVTFMGKKLSAPILISSITGGTKEAKIINYNLAIAAQKYRIAMAVGSQRIAIENKELTSTFEVRENAPDILLFSNLGAIQLNYGYSERECREVVDMIKADGLILHLNPLQESIQPEGNINFKGLYSKIERVVKKLNVPVVVKEVGCGISGETAKKLYAIGVQAVETAGWGGTNWALIEGIRRRNKLGEIFSSWGISTADSIVQCNKVDGLKVIGSGGIRNGIEIAKAIALGADCIGIALPFLKPATESAEAVSIKIQELIRELKVAMFCVGAGNINELKKIKLLKIDEN